MASSVDAPSGYASPQEVLSGPGASAAAGELLANWASPPAKVLVVRDRQVASLGLGDRLLESLETSGFEPVTFDEIDAEPTMAMASKAVDAARKNGVKAVVGLGGGSAMDMAKLAGAMSTCDHPLSAVIDDLALLEQTVPLVLVPTTAGTGSEATRVSMLSIEGRKRILVDRLFMPLAAILDPDLIATLPPAATASSGLDSIAHALESFISTNASYLTESASRSSLRIMARALPRAYADGKDGEARGETLAAAHLAGLSLNAGVTLGHSLAYVIAERTKLPHGVTAGMALPFALAYSLPTVSGRLDDIANEIPASSGADLLHWLLDLNTKMDVQVSLDAVGIDASDLSEMALQTVGEFPRPNNPVPLEANRLEVLLRRFHEGDLTGAIDDMTNFN